MQAHRTPTNISIINIYIPIGMVFIIVCWGEIQAHRDPQQIVIRIIFNNIFNKNFFIIPQGWLSSLFVEQDAGAQNAKRCRGDYFATLVLEQE